MSLDPLVEKPLSDDPHTQVHASIEGRDGDRVNGCNRLAFGVKNLPARLQRPAKYSWLIHAEVDAIALAARQGLQTAGATMRLDWFPCPACASAIVQAGIKYLYVQRREGDKDEKWEFGVSETILREGGVTICG